jgi:hypothetical protein
MVKASRADRQLVVDILTASFIDNKSVNYIARQEKKRISRLMEYSFDTCYLFGDIFLSEDKTGCALALLPGKKKTTLKSILLDIKLIITCVGLTGISKILARESKIKSRQLEGPVYYLWFLGVSPSRQRCGTGAALLHGIIKEGKKYNATVCLETSTLENIPWYTRHGFIIYNELDLGYKLFFLKSAS